MKASFENYIEQIQLLDLPRWTSLPEFSLYMDQVVNLVNQRLAPLELDELTAAMVNNYVKQKLVTPSEKKKYSAPQIAQLFMIALLKPVFSINEIHLLLQSKTKTFPQLYDLFVLTFTETLHRVTENFDQQLVLPRLKRNDFQADDQSLIRLSTQTVVQRLVLSHLLETATD